jgi:hypothetical protein
MARSAIRDSWSARVFETSLRANGLRECAPDDRLREAIHRAARKKAGLLRRSAPRNGGETYLRDPAACFARGLACSFGPLRSEGAGNAGRPMRPQAACARIVVVSTRVGQVTPESSGIPRAMVLRLTSCSPRRPALLPPSPADHSANLMPASGHQDHTTSPSASAPFVKGALASTASRPAFVTIAKRPSEWDGTAADRKVICANTEAKYFCAGGWTGKSLICPSGSPRRHVTSRVSHPTVPLAHRPHLR